MSAETIHALATAPGRAGVAVVRVSGPRAFEIVERLTRRPTPTERRPILRKLYAVDGGVLDEVLLLLFDRGRSFTGEEVAELHAHGSRAVVAAILREIDTLGLSRLAGPGEFTRRALANDRLDVLQVQGLGQLIEAETERQRISALRLVDGELGAVVRDWRQDLLEAAAYIEAALDFAEEDVPEDIEPPVMARLDRVTRGIERQLAGASSARRIRDGFVVAIVGRPNAGKSSLINAISKSDAAIVSEIPGTTRDVVEVRLDMDGLLVRLMDTAGLRETSDPIEQLGVERARSRARQADMRVLIRSDDTSGEEEGISTDLVVRSKVDLCGGIGVSSQSGEGIEELARQIGMALREKVQDDALVSDLDQEAILRRALELIAEARMRLRGNEADLAAENLRLAMTELSRIIGEVDVEDILEHIFRSFCIGK